MRELIKKILPPEHWRLPVIVLSGILVGLGSYLFYVSKAHSYLSDQPETCVNCHVMAPQFASWEHSAHREHTNCNDCHVPQDNFFRTYYFKAQDGLRHATIFTLRAEPQVIKIKEAGQRVVQENCIRCHAHLVTDHKTLAYTNQYHEFREDRQCWECHRTVPHGRVNSLSSAPNARVPVPKSPVPKWLKSLVE
jgi:cytochrome c nitrite reductase small subunit